MELPSEIKNKFFRALTGDIAMEVFEMWVYSDTKLEKYLSSDAYMELISLSYKKGDKYELRKFLKNYIDEGELEAHKMLNLLKEAQLKTSRLPYILIELYDLYCKGYDFLQNIALQFGLAVAAPTVANSTADSWEELTIEQQNEILKSFSSKLDDCIDEAINWLETKKIIITGEQNEIGHFQYKDLRT